MFTSTSKITFPGAGVSAIACSENSMKYMCKRFSTMIISYDKMNQLRHVRFLKNKEGVLAHMAKHRRRLVPCFDAVKTTFATELTPCGDIAHWTNPKGGYFISLYVMPGCAKRVAQLCKDCGLTLTGAGSATRTTRTPMTRICALRRPTRVWTRSKPLLHCSASVCVWQLLKSCLLTSSKIYPARRCGQVFGGFYEQKREVMAVVCRGNFDRAVFPDGHPRCKLYLWRYQECLCQGRI